MTPEQFHQLAQALPESLLLITGNGKILIANQSAGAMLNLSCKELRGKMLFDFVTEPREKVINYLQACSRSRQMVVGSLTLQSPDGETIMCRSKGAVIQPSSAQSPALNILRLENRGSANCDFILLNHKIEVEQRKQAQAELSRANEALQHTLCELQKTQIQLVQAEKMSSLGQLVAGVAHEINNPVSFIHGNVVHARKYIEELLELIHIYQQQYPHPTIEIKEKIDTIDLDFIKEDVDKVLHSMTVGTERISSIVKSLRNFSRLDEAEAKEVDVHEGIESTLLILDRRLRTQSNNQRIEVIKEYGQLPLVNCYPGQLNQVFMNLLSNAIDALEESGIDKPQISIRTAVLNRDWISIRIADNGSGITQKVCEQIFNPFFTTKPIGKGTGLGLSISYQIVTRSHGGRLDCCSEVGRGAAFIIEIPVNAKAKSVGS
ncbi:MAG: PAS domain-containing protein [Cyanomargarita calcarea GSE-NOS-MK-12-04C]|jgi:PAS domain S-box-containing protein|uniref:histidine kinase n=1 Tax=Cyanomargarita calcarea GSE-NOS-MK-12-04C TaxID=2839659 RepID=A0A951UR04_9CYAN|nr:PAS domain-containing protein [Cyanomargarita calcarea GSE-NOS-MK-12-04C]